MTRIMEIRVPRPRTFPREAMTALLVKYPITNHALVRIVPEVMIVGKD